METPMYALVEACTPPTSKNFGWIFFKILYADTYFVRKHCSFLRSREIKSCIKSICIAIYRIYRQVRHLELQKCIFHSLSVCSGGSTCVLRVTLQILYLLSCSYCKHDSHLLKEDLDLNILCILVCKLNIRPQLCLIFFFWGGGGHFYNLHLFWTLKFLCFYFLIKKASIIFLSVRLNVHIVEITRIIFL